MTGDPTVPPVDPPPIPRGRVPSRVLVHTGDGKGKTSAAMGIVMRGAARGWRVAVFQFVKDDRWRTGEESSARALGVDWWSGGDGFTWDSEDLDRTERVARAAWDAARAAIAAGEHHLVVLDEVTYPINWGWIAIDDMVAAIQSRPSHVNVVATGRDAPSALCDIADTVTEMASVKHAFDEGIGATRGIEF